MSSRVIAGILGLGLAIVARPALIAQGSLQNQPTFRSVTSLVPLDVRVLDRNGKPISNLTATDFTILEDNVQQKLGHFSVTTLPTAPARPIESGRFSNRCGDGFGS